MRCRQTVFYAVEHVKASILQLQESFSRRLLLCVLVFVRCWSRQLIWRSFILKFAPCTSYTHHTTDIICITTLYAHQYWSIETWGKCELESEVCPVWYRRVQCTLQKCKFNPPKHDVAVNIHLLRYWRGNWKTNSIWISIIFHRLHITLSTTLLSQNESMPTEIHHHFFSKDRPIEIVIFIFSSFSSTQAAAVSHNSGRRYVFVSPGFFFFGICLQTINILKH